MKNTTLFPQWVARCPNTITDFCGTFLKVFLHQIILSFFSCWILIYTHVRFGTVLLHCLLISGHTVLFTVVFKYVLIFSRAYHSEDTLLFQDFLFSFFIFTFQKNFRIIYPNSPIILLWFYGVLLDLPINVKKKCHLFNIEFSYPRMRYIFPFSIPLKFPHIGPTHLY